MSSPQRPSGTREARDRAAPISSIWFTEAWSDGSDESPRHLSGIAEYWQRRPAFNADDPADPYPPSPSPQQALSGIANPPAIVPDGVAVLPPLPV